jgi:amidase
VTTLADDSRWMDATEQAALVASGQVKPIELLEAAITRIEHYDPVLNAVNIRWFEHARHVAQTLPRASSAPFHGVPFLLKDLWAHHEGQTLSNGNVALRTAGLASSADTTLVRRFREAGLVIAGRTASPEFGSVPATESLAWGPTHNPWDTFCSPGGSSGGAAAAGGSRHGAIRSRQRWGGSIRIPASCCALVGLKPSQGRITLGPFRDESNAGGRVLCELNRMRQRCVARRRSRHLGVDSATFSAVM